MAKGRLAPRVDTPRLGLKRAPPSRRRGHGRRRAESLRPRPLSPHVEIWRWHITRLTSILHRATGVALYVGALILMAWALSLAFGPDAYASFKSIVGSIPGKVVLFFLTLSVFFHLANGLRHLGWDLGYGFNPKTADTTGLAAMAIAFGPRRHRAVLERRCHDLDGSALMAGIRTPLGRARGMGSAKHGVGHFIAQRVTGRARLVLLVICGAPRRRCLRAGQRRL